MRNNVYKSIIWWGLAGVMVFAPLARGAVELWAITLAELVVAVLVFLWLWRVNNRRGKEIASSPSAPRNDSREISAPRNDSREISAPRNDIRVRRTGVDWPIWLFFALAVVSCVFSIYRYASFLAMLRLMAMIGVFYLVVNNFGRRLGFRLVILVIIMGTAMSVLGLAQYSWGLEHSWWKPGEFLASTYVNHNHFAGYLEMAIPLAIGMVLARNSEAFKVQSYKILVKPGLVAALIIMFTALVVSQSRGAWGSLVISLIVMNVVLVRKKVLKKLSLLIFLLLIGLAFAFIYLGEDAVAKRLRTVEQLNNESFLAGRAKIWQGSINMIKDNPLSGTGIGTFVWGFPRYRPEGLNVRAHYAHNDYLQMMAEMGLLALPLLLWMIWVIVNAGFSWQEKEEMNRNVFASQTKYIEKNSETQKIKYKMDFGLRNGIVLGSAVGILSLALHGLVDFNFHIPANMLVVAALAGIIMRRAEKGIASSA